MRRTILSTTALVLSASLGCTGGLGGPDDADPGGRGAPSGADPGRVTMHRLNKVEYDNTVRDLLGSPLTLSDDFPSDDSGYGFDNISDVLSISPLQLELYERAAETLAEEALRLGSAAATTRVEAETADGAVGSADGSSWNLNVSGELPLRFAFPTNGRYHISVRVWGDQAGADPAKMALHVGTAQLGPYDITATSAAPVIIEADATVNAGDKVVSVEFLNDYYVADPLEDRNLAVDWVEVKGPLDVEQQGSSRDRILICDPASDDADDVCVRDILERFAERAFRRPVTAQEIDKLMSFVALAKSNGDTVEGGIQLALRAILTSPHFLFRVEVDPEPASASAHPLSDYELASRLSYFLWSSMPDDALFAAAKQGLLQDPAQIRAQVERMLDDPRADQLVTNFAGQWLYTRNLRDHQPDAAAFPGFDEQLRASMKTETELFFREFLKGDLPVGQMLNADFTYLDDRLAAHYGLPPVGEEFTRVKLDDKARGGLLSQGSILTVTSFATRTSPVKRGKWVLTQLLCSEPPPPPPGVEGLKQETVPTGSTRDRLEAHRQNPACAACHNIMDPLGFGLEHYDGIGAWRDDENGFPVDATGTMPTGETFDGVAGLTAILADDTRFSTCVAEKLFTYALGRGRVKGDAPHLDHINEQFAAEGQRLRDLIAIIATSEPFRLRRGEPVKGGQ